MNRAAVFLWNRLRPQEGWLPFFLLLATLSCLIGAVVEARWVPEGRVVVPTATFGLFFGVLLAKRPLRTWQAWTFIVLYGLLITVLYLAELWPSWRILFGNWEEYAQFNRQQVALFVDRWAGWIRAVSGSGRSRETIVFATGLALLAWHLGAYAGWSAFRQRRPLAGLSAVGAALAVNSYYGEVALWAPLLFIPLTATLTAVLNYAYMQDDWERNGISYPEIVRWEALGAAAAIGFMLLLTALIVPAVNPRALSRAFFAQESVREAQDAMEQAFAGVRQPRRAGQEAPPGGLPNSFLLGNAPALAETVVMTATANPLPPPGAHWRGRSYDVYTGRGWEISNERRERWPADEPIPLPSAAGTVILTQTVHWQLDDRATRYSLGLPQQFDQPTTLFWRGLTDLSQVQSGQGQTYTVLSRLSAATPAALRDAVLADVPAVLLGRYTELPQGIPDRVHRLAAEITAGQVSPYDRARAIEAFLRQYPYSLAVPPSPVNRDPVDYFLFDLQQGYCDYYASAMVVLARSAGLPARLATGFLAQPPAAAGSQTVVQLNAHSWAEVYFAGYGWVEFEPTAAFATRLTQPAPIDATGALPAFEAGPPPPTPPPLPPADRAPAFPWPLAGGVAAALLSLALRWALRRRHRDDADPVERAYGRLQTAAQRLGLATPASQTPAEFAAALADHLAQWPAGSRPAAWAVTVTKGARRLATLFIRHQYAPPAARPARAGEAAGAWRAIRRPLWWLRLYRWLRRSRGASSP